MPVKITYFVHGTTTDNSTESTNSEFKGRYKTMRGFGSFESGDSIIDGWTVHHDFVKRNRKSNKTNAERVGIKTITKANF